MLDTDRLSHGRRLHSLRMADPGSMSVIAMLRQLSSRAVVYTGMLTVPWFVVALYLAAYAIAGMAIGTVTGWVTSRMTKCTRQGIWKGCVSWFSWVLGWVHWVHVDAVAHEHRCRTA